MWAADGRAFACVGHFVGVFQCVPRLQCDVLGFVRVVVGVVISFDDMRTRYMILFKLLRSIFWAGVSDQQIGLVHCVVMSHCFVRCV